MSKIKYCALENTKFGKHSFYAKAMPHDTLTFKEMCRDAAKNTTYEESVMEACVREYMRLVQERSTMGFRCPVGDQFLVVYPVLDLSVKDRVDEKTGETIVATAQMLNAANGKSRLGCTVHSKFSKKFADEVTWKKVDAVTGASLEEEEDITQGNDGPSEDEPVVDTSTNTNTSGDDIPAGNG